MVGGPMGKGAAAIPRIASSSAAAVLQVDSVLMLQAGEGNGADVPDIGALALVASDDKPKNVVCCPPPPPPRPPARTRVTSNRIKS